MRDMIRPPDIPAAMMIAALSGSSVTVAELDSDLRYIAVYSPGRLLGGREAVGRTDVEIHGQPGAPLMALARAALAGGAPQCGRVSLAQGDIMLSLDVRITPVGTDETGYRLGLLATDVTEQVQLEAQILDRERFAATGRLAATVAHEVNTPLQAIESCLHLAGRVDDTAERARYLRLAREEIQRLGYTLRQLLDLYRPEGVQKPLDVNGLIERVLVLMSTSLARHAIKIERDLSNDLPVVLGRADEITQVLINLIFNAMQAMPHGGRLCLESGPGQCAAGGPCLIVRVRDSGVGIDPELHQRIFEPFYTTRADGTGLGLVVCKRIIEGHGGNLRVESAPGQGSCFIIEISIT
ncbi:MAG: ATP-binding protein [Chloroflexales bacterium]